MDRVSSSYYPPRARWYSPLLSLASGVRRHLALDRIRLPTGVPFFRALASLLVPGLGFYLRGPRLWGKVAMGFAALMALVFIVGLGYPIGNVAFGLLISTHVSSVLYVFEPWLAGERFRTRLLFSFVLLVLLGALVYMPVRNLIQERWLMPLQVKGRVVVVQRVANAATLSRGAWIAYTIAGGSGQGLYAREGFGLGPVLALPGDRVRFTKSALEVNGVPQPRLDIHAADGRVGRAAKTLVCLAGSRYNWPRQRARRRNFGDSFANGQHNGSISSWGDPSSAGSGAGNYKHEPFR